MEYKRVFRMSKVTKSSLFFKKFQKFSKFWFTKSRGHLSKKFTILRVLLSKILVSGRKFTKSRMFTIQWFTKSRFACITHPAFTGVQSDVEFWCIFDHDSLGVICNFDSCKASKSYNLPDCVLMHIQCLAEKLAVSLSEIRKAAVVFILDELQKSLIHGLKELKICHNFQH